MRPESNSISVRAATPYPDTTRTITIAVGWPRGGGIDVAARLLASALQDVLGARVEVVNRLGAAGKSALAEFVRAPPDGYSIAATPLPSVNAMYAGGQHTALFGRQDFEPLAMHVLDPAAVAVRKDSPYHTMSGLIAAALHDPRTIRMAHTGDGTPTHRGIQALQRATGARFDAVTFSGSESVQALANRSLTEGAVDASFGWAGLIKKLDTADRIRLLAVADEQRNPCFPDVPTLAEQGMDVQVTSARGYALPARTPRPIVEALDDAMRKAIDTTEMKQRMAAMGMAVRYMGPAEFAAYWDALDAKLHQ